MPRSQLTILVAGGAGYIGSETVRILRKVGYKIVVLDSLVNKHRSFDRNTLKDELIVGEIGNRSLLERIFATYSITAVMHFAAYAHIEESCQKPNKYYRNNVAQTITLLEAMTAASVNKLVFASTCAVYEIPQQILVKQAIQQPLNPYGASKLMCERIIKDFEVAHGLKSVIFRFDSLAGLYVHERAEKNNTLDSHLISSAMLTALGRQEKTAICGIDYPTPDGTCIRDYVHVSDLARAYVLGLQYLIKEERSNVFNLGNDSGFSVRQTIESTREIKGKASEVVESTCSSGDPPISIANSEKARSILGWRPQYTDPKDISTDAWNGDRKIYDSTKPLVTVIVPAYNAERFIARTLRSVLAQTYKNLEVIVVDDGSTDNTANIINAIAKTDRRVIFLQQSNAGVAAARNRAIANAAGEFIAPIDADDIWYEENIEMQVKQMQTDSRVGLVYSWSVDIDENDALSGGFCAAKIEGEVYKTLLCHNFIGNSSASLIRRSCLEEATYNCQMKLQNAQGCEDWELYLRIAEKYQFKVVPQFSIGYRKLSDSMSGDYEQMARSHDLILQTARKKYPQLPSIVYRLSRSNLYLYFAHQSNRCGKHETTLYWLYEALKADFLTPWLRLGLYRLSIASIFNMILRSTTKPIRNNALLSSRPLTNFSYTKTDIEQQKFLIKLKLIVGTLFHQIIDIITKRQKVESSGSKSLL